MKGNFPKPYYYIYPTINCGGAVYVNDVPVISNIGKKSETGMISGQMPVNHVLLQSGKYRIVGKMFPRYGSKVISEEESMTISIEMYNADSDWKKTDHEIHPKLESPWNGLSKGIHYPTYEIATEIEVDLPFVLNGWQNSVLLKDINKANLKIQVLEYYKEIHAILSEHNVSKFLELSKEKEELQAQAFYFDNKRRQELQQNLNTLFNENLETLPFHEDELKMEIFGYGRLVSLYRIDGSAALQFKSPNSEKESNVEIDIKLHRRQLDKNFSII